MTDSVCCALSVEQEKLLKNAVETKKKSTARVADIEDKLKNSKTVRERELKQAQKDVDQAKKRYDQSIAKTKEKEEVSCRLFACDCGAAPTLFYAMNMVIILQSSKEFSYCLSNAMYSIGQNIKLL